ncbi:MAG TPA: MgtC/SapB family protein [Chthoniobacter sp.]|jgi:putative Mg2+ transporter-C (MgtC) family protein
MSPLYVRVLAESWYRLVPSPWSYILLVLMAVVCGAIVGGERERREKPAGLRTLTFVCLGSAVFTMTGFAFTSSTGDSGRVAAQIVTGIGFLGAGVILHGRGTISGTTTAATIWLTAAIGMTVASGYACAGVGLSFIVRGILLGVRHFEVHRLGLVPAEEVTVDFLPDNGKTRVRIERVLVDYLAAGVMHEWVTVDETCMRMKLRLRLPVVHARSLLAELAEMPQVLSIERRPEPAPGDPGTAATVAKPSPGALMNPGGAGKLGKN